MAGNHTKSKVPVWLVLTHFRHLALTSVNDMKAHSGSSVTSVRWSACHRDFMSERFQSVEWYVLWNINISSSQTKQTMILWFFLFSSMALQVEVFGICCLPGMMEGCKVVSLGGLVPFRCSVVKIIGPNEQHFALSWEMFSHCIHRKVGEAKLSPMKSSNFM